MAKQIKLYCSECFRTSNISVGVYWNEAFETFCAHCKSLRVAPWWSAPPALIRRCEEKFAGREPKQVPVPAKKRRKFRGYDQIDVFLEEIPNDGK